MKGGPAALWKLCGMCWEIYSGAGAVPGTGRTYRRHTDASHECKDTYRRKPNLPEPMRQDRNTRQDTTTNQDISKSIRIKERRLPAARYWRPVLCLQSCKKRGRTGPVVQYPCVSCLGKYAGAAYGNVPIFSGGDPAVSLFTGTVALGREADSPAGETEVRAKEEKSGWSGEKSPGRKRLVSGWFAGLLLAAGILYFLYVACCGINYYRTSFTESSGIVAEEYTVGELYRGLPVADG